LGNCFILGLILVMVMVLKKVLAFFALVLVFALAVSLAAFNNIYFGPLDLATRLFALNGFIALSIAAMMSPFLKEITLFFRKSFVSVHHYFAAVGLLLITLHPIGIVILALNPILLLPNFNTLYLFLFYGGSIALLAIYIAFGAVLLRKKFNFHWRTFHALMYLALFLGVIHANLAGLDFQKIYLMGIYDGLFAGVLVAFGLKRLQFYRIKARKNTLVNHAK
jgi:methionine sulfoxide reductase heme-binding subunit